MNGFLLRVPSASKPDLLVGNLLTLIFNWGRHFIHPDHYKCCLKFERVNPFPPMCTPIFYQLSFSELHFQYDNTTTTFTEEEKLIDLKPTSEANYVKFWYNIVRNTYSQTHTNGSPVKPYLVANIERTIDTRLGEVFLHKKERSEHWASVSFSILKEIILGFSFSDCMVFQYRCQGEIS